MSAENPVEIWKSLQSKVHEAVQAHFPVEGRSRRLVLKGLHFDESEAPHTDIRSQEQAKAQKRTWGVPVHADVALVDKTTGKEVDRQKIKLLTLPKPTNRYSYIVDGSEWQIDNLWKLKSGVYAHVQQNGQLQAEFNLAKPFAREPRLYVPFDPQSKQFKLKYATTNVPLYSILKTLGVQDEDMKKAWGDDIYKANVTQKTDNNIKGFYDRLTKRGVKASGGDLDAMASAIVKEFDNTRLLPDTTKLALGKPLDRVNGDALLLASKKILEVARGNTPPDDRDSLVFKRLHGVDDFIYDKLTGHKTKKTIVGKIGNNLDKPTAKIRDIISGDLFNRPIKEFFTTSTLSRNPEQVNPLEMITNHRMTTIIGGDEGGIKNERAVITSMKLINPSHFGFLDPLHTPESEKTGISLHLPLGVKKVGNEAKTVVYNLKTGKTEWVTPAELHSEPVVLPDQVKWEAGKPKPVSSQVKVKDPLSHEIVEKPFSHGHYLLLSPHQLFNETTNLIPFLQNNQGNRTMMAAKQATQAIPLAQREQPLVQVSSGSKSTWERIIGTPWSHTATVDGRVVQVKTHAQNGHAESVVIQDSAGKRHEVQLYNHFPLNDAKSFLHSSPLVKAGDTVKKGQVIADSNFTKDGHLALGTNLRVGYMPYKGYNFEDGIVISESAAKRLASEHMHRKEMILDPEKDTISRDKFLAYASTTAKKLTQDQIGKLDQSGVVKVGQTVHPGDVLVAAVGKRDLTGEAARLIGRLGKKALNFQDKSIVWDSDHPGQVVGVVQHPGGKGITVHVKTIEPAEIGDKMVGRHGNKGIITKILPDHEMPRIGGSDGQHVEVLMNPTGVPTRINLGQMLETAASKIAQKTGQPYIVNNFPGSDVDYTKKVRDDLKKHGLSDTEVLFDPNGKQLGEVLTGNQYILKLKHQVEKKLNVRGVGPSYSIDHSPRGTGADHPGQGLGQLEFYSLLAHGARHNLREMATYKADRQLDENMNPQAHVDFWHRVQTGQPLPAPKPTFAYKKFEAMLTGLGVNVDKKGHELYLKPLTDKGVLALSNGEIKDPGRLLRAKDAKELEKGLFDPKVTGGLPTDVGKGLFWSHISLSEPFPNPIFVGTKQHAGPAVVLSGLKFDEFEDVVKGKKQINGMTGGKAIESVLKKIDVKAELKQVQDQLPSLRGSALDKANRKARFLKALDEMGMKPHEAYLMNHVPVLPPVFRPIVVLPNGSLRPDDVNLLYKNLGHINEKLKNPVKELGDVAVQPLREQAYDALKAITGLGGKPVYESNRKLKGVLDVISGKQPKEGFFQDSLIKRRQELSMRSTIIPEPAMHLDFVGLPKNAALELYKPFVVRELGKMGYNPLEAHKQIKTSTDASWRALQRAMDNRPVLLKRDPALHKFNIMAFKPKLVEGRAVQIHPLVTAGFNADFDGDTMSAFVPLTDEAVQESHRMFPSNNLFSATTGSVMYSPDQESLLGLHLLTKWGKKISKSFSTFQDALKAKERGTIDVNDVVKIGGKETTVGRLMFAQHLPDNFRKDEGFAKSLQDPSWNINKGVLKGMLGDLAKTDPKQFSITVDKIKDLGNKHSYEAGFSFGLDDLDVNHKLRDSILKKYDTAASKIKASKLSEHDKNQKIIDLYSKATEELEKHFKPFYKGQDNNLFTMIDSGARGKWGQFRQMTIAPMLMKDGVGNTLPTPVKKSYSEGLDLGDYWTTLHGARMGTLQRVQGTSEPGRLSKEIVNVVIPNLVVSADCGTSGGVALDVTDHDVHDRYLAAPVRVPGRTLAAGTLVTPDVTALLKKHKVDKVVVRSPLKCSHGHGLCAKCFGLTENGHMPTIGTNIGVISGQALGEPATQLAMDSFHSGGIAASRGAHAVDKFTRLNQLLEMPKTLPNSATLAKASGPVQKIEKDHATNGWNVFIGGEKHFVPAQRQLMHRPLSADQGIGSGLKVGMTVKKGDPLTDGAINPHHLLPLTDIHTVQNYLTHELHNSIYKDERVKRRHIETVVRSLTNLAKVKDPGDSDHFHGDLVLRTVADEHNRKLDKGHAPIVHQPVLSGARQLALEQHEDWMARLNFQKLKNTILEGTAKGWKTNLHGMNPIAPYAHGAAFGLGTKDKPHLY